MKSCQELIILVQFFFLHATGVTPQLSVTGQSAVKVAQALLTWAEVVLDDSPKQRAARLMPDDLSSSDDSDHEFDTKIDKPHEINTDNEFLMVKQPVATSSDHEFDTDNEFHVVNQPVVSGLVLEQRPAPHQVIEWDDI